MTATTLPHHIRTVLSIGNFDGVHLGHAAICRRAKERALQHTADTGEACEPRAMVFVTHPATLLRPDDTPAVLSDFDQRREWLHDAGCSHAIPLEPSPELLAMDPETFVRSVLLPLKPVAIVEGPDFRFGKGRAGTIDTLRQIGAGLPHAQRFDVLTVDPVHVALDDHAIVRASSTLTRWLLRQGRVRDAAHVLGRWHELTGVVIPGDRRGRTIGYPTANIHSACMVPGPGVYAAVACVPSAIPADPRQSGAQPERCYAAAVSIGSKPTFAGGAFTVEAHLLDVPRFGDGPCIADLPEYGWPIRLRFVAFLRDQIRFPSIPALAQQLDRDCQRARRVLLDQTTELPERQTLPTPSSAER